MIKPLNLYFEIFLKKKEDPLIDFLEEIEK